MQFFISMSNITAENGSFCYPSKYLVEILREKANEMEREVSHSSTIKQNLYLITNIEQITFAGIISKENYAINRDRDGKNREEGGLRPYIPVTYPFSFYFILFFY